MDNGIGLRNRISIELVQELNKIIVKISGSQNTADAGSDIDEKIKQICATIYKLKKPKQEDIMKELLTFSILESLGLNLILIEI